MVNIKQFGKGAIKYPKELRDKQFRIFALGAPVIDWNVPYSVENGFILKQRDQDGSSSCTGQATSYYNEALVKVEHNKDEKYSARYLYSQSYLPGGGAYIWKAMSIPLKGIASADSVPDGDSTEVIMTDSSLNDQAIIEARTDKYAVIPRSNIDQLAQVIRDYQGFVTGFNGWNGMFDSQGIVRDWSKVEWAHAVYCVGYCAISDLDDLEVKAGRMTMEMAIQRTSSQTQKMKKYLKFKNSWTANWGSDGYGYFPEEFVNSGLMFDCYTYANIADIDPISMNNRFVQVAGQKDVWLIKNNQRSLVYNYLAFSLIGEPSQIENITQSQLDAIPDNGKVLAGLDQE